MVNKKLKINKLAKLRQFSPGMDVEKFLSGEFRQFVRAIEEAGIDLSGFSRCDFLATKVDSFSIGIVAFDDYVLNYGSISSNSFKPETDGTYWVDFGMEMTPSTAGAVNYLYLNKDSVTRYILTGDLATVGKVYYVTGRALVEISKDSNVLFHFDGTSDTTGFNFYCSFTKVS